MHRWIPPLLTTILSFQFAVGGEIRWTASGTVDLVFGPGLLALASVSDPVAIEFAYNDAALREDFAISEFPEAWSHLEYREDVNIDFEVTIGASTWEGTLVIGSEGAPRTIEVQNFNVGPETVDFFKLAVSAADGASFASFPGVAVGAAKVLSVEFSDGSDTAAGPDFLGSNSLVCVAQSVSRITKAKGAISDGVGEFISYVIDPSSIATEIVGIQTVALKEISFLNDEVFLTWVSIPGKSYVIEYLDEFLCWRFLSATFAVVPETTLSVFPAGVEIPKSQLYRVVEEE
ncbi:MAG: hypothetical protein ABGZ49_10655 [Akkermansiaceae bacterium]